MRFFSLSLFPALFCIALFAATGCTTSSIKPTTKTSFEGSFSLAGLKGIKVNNFNTFKGSIYASTDHGLYEKTPGRPSWVSRGLQQDSVKDVAFLRGNKLLVAVHHKYVNSGQVTLFLSTDGGENWRPFMNNFGGVKGKYTYVASLATATKPSDTVFAHVSDRSIARSTTGGQKWEMVTGVWNLYGGAQEAINADPNKSGTIWAAGANPFVLPYLLMSPDYGETWKNMDNVGTASQICYDVISDPEEPNIILTSLVGSGQSSQIRKSTDGGQSWETIMRGFSILTLLNSKRNPNIVYASGRNPAGTLFFAASADFGNTWKTVEWKNSPGGLYINDMVSVMQGDREVLYLGTNEGVYSYTFEE